MKNEPDNTGNDRNLDKAIEKLELENEATGFFEMPEMNEIPGQNHLVGWVREYETDATISSEDEEGGSLWKDPDQDLNELTCELTAEELSMLEENASWDHPNARPFKEGLQLEDTDWEGDPLNESSFNTNHTGDDLDIPGADLDDENEKIGEEDEENNYYSQADTD